MGWKKKISKHFTGNKIPPTLSRRRNVANFTHLSELGVPEKVWGTSSSSPGLPLVSPLFLCNTIQTRLTTLSDKVSSTRRVHVLVCVRNDTCAEWDKKGDKKRCFTVLVIARHPLIKWNSEDEGKKSLSRWHSKMSTFSLREKVPWIILKMSLNVYLRWK